MLIKKWKNKKICLHNLEFKSSKSEDFTSFSFSNLALNDNSAISHLLILKQGKFVRNYKISKRSDTLS